MKKIKVFFTAMVMLLSVAAFAQTKVSGTVSDPSGEPVAGANVVLKGSTTVYTMTDNQGKFSISVPADGVLSVNCLGFVSTEVDVAGKTQIDVVLENDAETLDETIVVAYGTATKASFTGSAAMVKGEEISKKITSNVTSALAGAAPGVQILNSSGDPTSNAPTIRIRGIGSMSASNAPLIVVDGVPYEGSISDINPNDVESLSVLKDASASAIYGHRGANGVVLITTKKGSGEATVKFDGRWGVNSRLIPQYDVITNPAEYYETHYKMMYNSYIYSGHSEAEAFAYADKKSETGLYGRIVELGDDLAKRLANEPFPAYPFHRSAVPLRNGKPKPRRLAAVRNRGRAGNPPCGRRIPGSLPLVHHLSLERRQGGPCGEAHSREGHVA